MILIDTSVWIEHLRRGEPRLAVLLEEMTVLTHPFVIGELALGQLERREEILDLLSSLPSAKVATDDEVHTLIDRRGFAGSGIGWVDAHLIASALLSNASLMTLDRKLGAIASLLDLLPRS